LSSFTGCGRLKEKKAFECSLVELTQNSESDYYDAVVKVERFIPDSALKDSFSLLTPTNTYILADLSFMEDGENSERLEMGDVFIVPLRKPDWEISIKGQNDISCVLDFWEMLPVHDQWHPTKSEAMEVAQGIEVELVEGLLKPVVKNLPEEWQFIDERLPDYDDPCGYVVYQKLRADIVKEEVNIQYCFLMDYEIKELSSGSDIEFLFNWADWTKKYGKAEIIVGRDAVYWDMKGMGEFGWAFRYAYIDSEMVIDVNIHSDPLEWVKTEQEKILEGKARKVFLRYGYGPVGDAEWQIMIEIMMNGDGLFHKRSKDGTILEKAFSLEDRELEEIQVSINENRFRELRSRSGVSGGMTTFLSVRYGDQYHTVELKNVSVPLYQKIEKTIKSIVLPKVDKTDSIIDINCSF